MNIDNPVEFSDFDMNFDAGNDFLLDDGAPAAGITSLTGSARKRKADFNPVSYCFCTAHDLNI